jgi:hypothetical protein
MGYVSNAMVEMAEAGAVMAEMDEVRAWRAAGHDVPLMFVEVDTYRGRRPMPALAIDVAERLAVSLEDEDAREGLRQAVADARACLPDGRLYRCDQCGRLGLSWFFPVICSPERLCAECA